MQIQTLRQQQKENTRRGLIRAATNLFSKHGISNTATADIANTLQVSHGTVFLHFPSREDLIVAVIEEFGTKLSDAFNKSILEELTLKEVLKAHLDVLCEFEDFYFRLITEMHALPSQVRSLVFMLNSAISCKMYEAAKPLVKTGKIQKIEQHLLFNTWIGLINHYVINRDILSNSKPILAEKNNELIKHYYRMVEA